MKTKTRIAGRIIEVLLVEDNRGDENFMREILKGIGFPLHLSVARDGEEALAFLQRQGIFSKAPKPDVILLDLYLPKKNGIEVLIEIRLNNRLENIPVFILTGSQDEMNMQTAAQFRANYYINKPMDMVHFKEMVKYFKNFWLKTFQVIEKES